MRKGKGELTYGQLKYLNKQLRKENSKLSAKSKFKAKYAQTHMGVVLALGSIAQPENVLPLINHIKTKAGPEYNRSVGIPNGMLADDAVGYVPPWDLEFMWRLCVAWYGSWGDTDIHNLRYGYVNRPAEAIEFLQLVLNCTGYTKSNGGSSNGKE